MRAAATGRRHDEHDTTNTWRTEDGSHFFGPFARRGEFEIEAAVGEVHRTWSPTRSAAGFTARAGGRTLGEHFATAAEARAAVVAALA